MADQQGDNNNNNNNNNEQPPVAAEGFEVDAWFKKNQVQAAYLTLGQVLNMKEGEEHRFLCLDRNCLDPVVPGADPLPPLEFFKGGYFLDFKHGPEGGLAGQWRLMWDGYENPGPPDYGFERREFDVCYSWDDPKRVADRENWVQRWYPLQNDCLQPLEGRNWRQLLQTGVITLETWVGWRGPMIDIQKAGALPPVFMQA